MEGQRRTRVADELRHPWASGLPGVASVPTVARRA
ncbi:hypothetical protein J2S50_000041 [Streptomyces sp. DSM 40167]|nr:hypothetical protein [Streptomyces sp. DSM 40167]